MTSPRVADGRVGSMRSELIVHAAAVALGPLLVLATFPDAGAGLLARAAALPLALSLVVHGLLGALDLGRAEWRRATPGARDYLRVVARFAAAFVLAGASVG